MAFSPFDHPWFSALLNRSDIDALFGVDADIAAMLRFEAALAEVEAAHGVIPKTAAPVIAEAARGFRPDVQRLAAGVARDGVVVPTLIACLRQAVGEANAGFVHVGATSQDVIDTSLMLRIKEAFPLFRDDLAAVLGHLDSLKTRDGQIGMMAKTRMQRALPITFADRCQNWMNPLQHHLDDLEGLSRQVPAVQFGGAVGTLERLGDQAANIRADLATRLGLIDPGRAWHTDRSRLVDFGNWLAKTSGSLGKIGQDLVLMAQNEVGEVSFPASGRSSAMPFKQNPIQAELLVTLARFNAGQLASMHQALVHEGERSGAAWTLEWLILPEMIAATAASLKLAATCLEKLRAHPSREMAPAT
ncbi:MAG: 3-carboxy-cis,cis-muconate cycloisomerase [Geminicoccaceae bacterium]